MARSRFAAGLGGAAMATIAIFMALDPTSRQEVTTRATDSLDSATDIVVPAGQNVIYTGTQWAQTGLAGVQQMSYQMTPGGAATTDTTADPNAGYPQH